jgi:ElaB/YqjD/DUF883 family membrane-anchored ribosome-binding protein
MNVAFLRKREKGFSDEYGYSPRQVESAMETKDTRVNDDIAALMGDLRRLREDFAEWPNRIRACCRDIAMRSRERLRTVVSGFQDRAKDRVRDTSGMLRDHGYQAVDTWRGAVANRPIVSVAAAFAAGWLLGMAVEHRHRWH